MSDFRLALGKHLLAIEERDLDALAATVAPDGVLLVMSDGRLTRTAQEFLQAHRAWFAMKHWRLDVKPVQIYESNEIGVALLHLEYRDHTPGQVPTRQTSFLTAVFRNRDGAWRMVHNQNTPIK